jgi:hypothetical protein
MSHRSAAPTRDSGENSSVSVTAIVMLNENSFTEASYPKTASLTSFRVNLQRHECEPVRPCGLFCRIRESFYFLC